MKRKSEAINKNKGENYSKMSTTTTTKDENIQEENYEREKKLNLKQSVSGMTF